MLPTYQLISWCLINSLPLYSWTGTPKTYMHLVTTQLPLSTSLPLTQSHFRPNNTSQKSINLYQVSRFIEACPGKWSSTCWSSCCWWYGLGTRRASSIRWCMGKGRSNHSTQVSPTGTNILHLSYTNLFFFCTELLNHRVLPKTQKQKPEWVNQMFYHRKVTECTTNS